MRGAAGAIERTQGPAAMWLRESSLALPFYVAGVLLAVIVAARIVGPVIRSRGALVTSMLVIVAGGTSVGTAMLAASSAYDYRLQLDLIATGGAMPGMCATAACLTDQQQSSYALQVHVVWLGALYLLLTNLVVVAWVVAARGGRLDLSRDRVRSVEVPVGAPRARVRDRSDDLALVVAVGLVGSAVIHAAVVPEHVAEWAAAGVFFVVLAVVQVVLAVLVVVRRTPTLLLAVAVAALVPLVLWVVSRSVGLPFGPAPGVPEPLGLADVAAGALELLTLVLAGVLLSGDGQRHGAAFDERAVGLALAAVVAVTALGVGGTDLVPITTGVSGPDTMSMLGG
jgi:hypothetical protein